jgi:hypothetical protein
VNRSISLPEDAVYCDGSPSVVVGDGDDRPRHDPVQQIGLPRLERDQPAEHIEEIQQVLRIFGEPAFGLNLFERRRRPLVADHQLGPGASTTSRKSQRARPVSLK